MVAELESLFRLNKSHIEPAIDVLDRAFEDNPLNIAFLPDKSERKKKARHIFEFFLRYGFLYGEVYATSPKLEAVAMWLTSEKADFTLWRMLRSGVIPFIFRYGIKNVLRMISITNVFVAIHKNYAPFPHLYAWYIGVDPEFQGKGYGSTLHRAMLAKADSKRLPCYLETQKEENAALWSRYGFKVIYETIIPGTEVRHWAMLREKAG
jgi:GNAT superfamily N-acetyltransferase